MARTSLRAYQRDVEELIETHQFDQAIAHCRHILRFYPKEVNSYRLLGKAYLESQRYGDASDIFIRVLSTIPDDFVSHVGMSIIREDEGNLDEAIWHMQRAFETQPANSAIQGELRRLHGRREGIEPPKIRLTRGALARMYLKGELYSQALAELRAGLHEDAKRYDLQVVLAQAYFLAGQRVDAAEACSTLLKSLPYCLEANKILADILSHSERSEEAQVYKNRSQALDPYLAHLSPTAPTPEKVADSAVLLEKLEWRPGLQSTDTVQQPEWATSLGVDLGTVTGPESLPDWLGATEAKTASSATDNILPFEEMSSESAGPAALADSEVPDWMKDAGWTEAQTTEAQGDFLPLTEAEGIEQELTPADIPDWLKTMAPPTEADSFAAPPAPETSDIPVEETEQAATLPWLEETPPGPTDSVAMWLDKQEPAENLEAQLDMGPASIENIPDWLQDLGEPIEKQVSSPVESAEEAQPEELTFAPETESDRSDIESAAILAVASAALAADRREEEAGQEPPEGLAEELQSEAVMSAGIEDWLKELGSAGAEPEGERTDDFQIETTPPSPEEPLAEAQIPEWIQNLEPEAQPGDWVTELSEDASVEEAPMSEAETALAPEAKSTEEDEAFAWLENLAARQGAEEALLLNPEERRETPPDWILSDATEEEKTSEQAELRGEVFGAAAIAAMVTAQADEEQEVAAPVELAQTEVVEQPETELQPETVVLPEPEAPVAEAEPIIEPAMSETVSAQQTPEELEALRADEPAAESQMLFYPMETAGPAAEASILDEGPITESDTKPTTVKAPPVEAIAALAAATVVMDAASGEDETFETPPETATPLTSAGEFVSQPEPPDFPEPSGTGDEIVQPAFKPEKPIAEGVVLPEEDEAFAWLESLAVRQGAEEALLLAPEERQETPPEWVIQEAAETEEAQPAEKLEEAELPTWLQEEPAQVPEVAETVKSAEGVPDWLKEPAAISGETPIEQELPPLAPELPTWLAGVEDTQNEAQTVAWTPSEEGFAAGEPEEDLELQEALSETMDEAVPAPTLDLNQAGLIDLERLPGVGFTRAQAILDYRQQHGPFQDIDELLLVNGITPDLLLELNQVLTVGGTLVTTEVEPPAEDHQILLMQARNALVQGDIPLAISRYGILIEKQVLLPDVITDMNEALYRFPIDVSIWEALGDAQLRAGHLQEALNAYTKAEEYLH